MTYVTIAKFSADTGDSEKAVRRKIEEGVWIEGRHFRRAPDNRVLIDTDFVASTDLEPIVVTPPPAATSGVYLLMQGDTVVYVGRSNNMNSRLTSHRRNGRQFDEAQVIPCDAVTSVWLEKELIRTLRPIQNVIRFNRHAEILGRLISAGAQ